MKYGLENDADLVKGGTSGNVMGVVSIVRRCNDCDDLGFSELLSTNLNSHLRSFLVFGRTVTAITPPVL